VKSPSLDLKDIHLPADPSWWPPAPGWWALAVLLIVALAIGLPWAWRRGRSVRQRRLTRVVFNSALAAPDLNLAQLSELLRRAVRLRDPNAAALTGEAWLAHLDDALKTREFLGEAGRELLAGPFKPLASAPSAALLDLCQRWAKRVLK